jgi:hypothetical protein
MVADPLFVIQNKWEAIQSYKHSYMKEYSPYFLGCRYHNIILSYVPGKHNKSAALNFHLTSKEKEDLYLSLGNEENKKAINTLVRLLQR